MVYTLKMKRKPFEKGSGRYNNVKKLCMAVLLVLVVLLFSACVVRVASNIDFQLRGTWVTTNHNALRHTPGTFEIGFTTITIYDYTPIPPSIFSPSPPPPYLPFATVPRGTPFTGNSEDDRLEITLPGVFSYSVSFIHHPARRGLPERLTLMFSDTVFEILERKPATSP